MFLQVMNTEEKMKFLEFVYKIANIDGEYAEEEIEIVNSYKNELGINEIPETDDINSIIEYFSTKEEVLKRIIIFETVGLINADNKIEPEEADLMNKMVKSFHLDSEVVEKIDMVAKRLQDVYDDVYTAIFD